MSPEERLVINASQITIHPIEVVADDPHRCICPGLWGLPHDQCKARATQEDMLCNWCRVQEACIAVRKINQAKNELKKVIEE